MPDRGQSEVLGYFLVFSLVVLTVALVTVSGQAGLTDARDQQRTANVEAGFVTLADNVDEVVLAGAPSRATEIALSGERAGLGDPVRVSVSARSTATGALVFDRSVRLRPVVYTAPDGARVVYAGGAVVAQGADGGAAMLRDPSWVLSPDRTVVALVNTTVAGDGPSWIDGESRVLVRTERREVRTLGRADATVDVTVTVESPRAAAWETSLDDAIDPAADDCTRPDDTTVSCQITTDRAAVVLHRLAVSFE